ncbi:MAG: hypothetical protein ACKVP7_06525 [Hyphomicrobiaceae bacterium]
MPAWPESATRALAFWRGTRAGIGLPSVILVESRLGYSAFAKACGLTFGLMMWLPLMLQALLARLVLADHAARDVLLAATAMAASLFALLFGPGILR